MAVTLEFLADISGATKEITGFTKSLDSQFRSLTNTILGAGAALGIGFSFKKAIDEAVRAEDALNNFNIVLKQTGIFSESTSKSFANFADELEKSTSIASEDILDLAGKIQTLTGVSASDLSKLTAVTLDFAKASNIGFETAGTLVSKALNGQTEALKRYGISLKDTGSQVGNLNSILTTFAQFQGTAADRALTFSGRLKQLQIQFGNLLEEIGNIIIKNPLVLKSFDGLISAFEEIKTLIRENEKQFAKIVSFIASTFVSAIKLLGEAILGVVDIFDFLRLTVFKAQEILVRFVIAYKEFAAIFSRGNTETGLSNALEGDLNKLDDIKKKILGVKLDLAAETINKGQAVKIEKETKITFDTKKGRGKIGDGENAKAIKNREDADRKAQQERQRQFNIAGSLITNISQGAQGAAAAFQNVSGFIADSIIPGLGGVVSGLVGFLAQGPEAVKAQIQAFIDAIPEVIQAIIDSIPAVIEALANAAPVVAISLANQMPFVATKLAVSLISESPNIAKAFIQSLISESGRLIQSIADGVKEAIKSAAGFAGGGGVKGALSGSLIGGIVGGPIGSVGGALKKLKFAEGGVVPGGAPFTDRVPAMLTPGEVVLSRDQVREVQQERASASGGSDRPMTINLMVGEQELANVILNLNRQGFRLQ